MAEAVANNVPAKASPIDGKPPLFGLSFLENLSEMTMLRQVGLLVGLAASVAIGFAVVLWSQQPDYRPLYGSLAGMDAKQVMDTLASADIPYTVEPNSGALLVKADDVQRARIKLAAAGVAQTDGNIGFEILDKDQGLGTSQFMEATRYRRGLEGELARTISSLNNIKAARVHLAIPKSSVFVRDDRKPSASILVELYAGRSLEPGQVMAIINLVATSVPELSKSQVTVVDQKGNLLSDVAQNSELTMAGKQFDYSRRMESMLTQRVHNILQPVLGNDRYKAEVSADVDFSAVESTSESFNPDQPALRSEQSVNEQRSSGSGPSGVPGALSNQPPGPATAPQNATAAAGGAAGPIAPGQPLLDANGQQIMDPATGQPMLAPYPADKRVQSTKNFELDRSISHTKQQQGRVNRLSVAVVVDDQIKVNPANGQTTTVPWSTEDLARFTRLVQEAVGFDASRGDSVSVVNVPFSAERGEVIPDIPFYSQPWFWDVLKQVLGVLFILALVFGVLRPVLNNITNGKSRQLAGLDSDVELGGMGGLGELGNDRVSLGGPQSILLPSPSEGYDAQLNAIKSLVAEDPGRVAQVDKAAILLLSLGETDAAQVLRHMGPKEVQRVGVAMAQMRNVHREQVEQVMSEFVEVVGDQTSVGIGSDGYIRKMLTQALGEDKANGLIDRILLGGNTSGLDSLKWMEPRAVADVIRFEHPQIQAIVVAYLDPDQAGEVLGHFDHKARLDIILRVSSLNTVQPAALKELNQTLEKQFSGNANTSRTNLGGIKRAADIMNFLDSSIEGQLMDSIREVDEDLSGQIEDLMFVFNNLSDVDDRGIQALLREVSSDVLELALKGSDDAIKEKIFKNMSKRAAELLRDDLEAKGPVRVSDVETAQKEILTIARRMAEAGEIVLGGKGGEEMI